MALVNRTVSQFPRSESDSTLSSLRWTSDLSTFRDRTAEFGDIIQCYKNRQTKQQSIPDEVDRSHQLDSNFRAACKRIAENLNRTGQKLEKLSLLSQRALLFDGRSDKVDNLIDIIRQDTTNLNSQICQLQQVSAMETSRSSKSVKNHSKAIILGLQAELANISGTFRSILESREMSVEAQNERRSKFSNSPRNSMILPSKNSFLVKHEERHRMREAAGVETQGDQQGAFNTMQANQLTYKDSYLDERTDAMRNVEETIVQLGEIFQQLAVMVKEQDEMVQRIDANIEEVHFNLESATLELKKYFHSISANRWLMIKVFLVLFLFLFIFVVFFL